MLLPVPREITAADALQHYVRRSVILKTKEKTQLSKHNQLIEKVRQTARQIVDEAKKEKEKLLSAAREEYEKGFDSGKEKGKQLALKEGLRWLMKTHEIKTVILDQVKDHVLDTLESVLMHVFQNAAPDWIKTQLEKILISLDAKEEVEIHISEADAAKITEVISSGEHKGMNIEVIHNPEDEGSCFVRTRYFEAEFSVSRLKETLLEAFQTSFEEIQH